MLFACGYYVSCFIQKKDMFVLFVPMFFNVKPMLCCWFLRFSYTENLCLFRWFLCFSQSNHCFFVCSYALQHKTIAFSLVPVFFTIKPMLCRSFLCVVFLILKHMFFDLFLCFSSYSQCCFRWFLWLFHGSQCFFVGPYAFLIITYAFSFVPMLLHLNQCFVVRSYVFLI